MLGKRPSGKVAKTFGLHEHRARTLAAGVIILSCLQARLGVPLEVSRAGLREGRRRPPGRPRRLRRLIPTSTFLLRVHRGVTRRPTALGTMGPMGWNRDTEGPRAPLAGCEGYGVFGPSAQIRVVEKVRLDRTSGRPALLSVRAGLLGSWLVHVPVDEVDEVTSTSAASCCAPAPSSPAEAPLSPRRLWRHAAMPQRATFRQRL